MEHAVHNTQSIPFQVLVTTHLTSENQCWYMPLFTKVSDYVRLAK